MEIVSPILSTDDLEWHEKFNLIYQVLERYCEIELTTGTS
jgi:hypothetical protein